MTTSHGRTAKPGLRIALAAWLVGMSLCMAGCDDSGSSSDIPLVPSTFAFWDNPRNWTTQWGPAYADILEQSSNFVPCKGGPIALCYYSGPNPLPCTPTADGRFANCACEEIPYGAYFVDINAILNYEVYLETVRVCGADGSACTDETNLAPVCGVINDGELIPGADLISAFSFACAPEEGIGQTSCSKAVYAGCMTAACYRTSEPGIVSCQCPTYDGPFDVGNFGAQCSLPAPGVWSAAYSPNEGTLTVPTPPGCVPDAPGDVGCPLLSQGTVVPPASGVDCSEVCSEYSTCQNQAGVQVGYTCDATLCTSECEDQDLVRIACDGLSTCDVSEIIKLEAAAQCSCCASQLCGCTANSATNAALVELNDAQAERGIDSQCQLNGTLCGQ